MELERSADRAQARAGLAAAAAFLQRAVELTADPARRADRALAAAQASLEAGAFDSAGGLVARAETGELDEFQRARADLVRGQIALSCGAGGDAAPLLLKAARRLESLDLDLARDTYLDALVAAALAGPADRGARLEICRAVRALPAPARDPRPIERLLDGACDARHRGASCRLVEVVRGGTPARRRTPLHWDRLGAGWLVSAPSSAMWDNDGIRTTLTRRDRARPRRRRPRATSDLSGHARYRHGPDWRLPGGGVPDRRKQGGHRRHRSPPPPIATLLLVALRGRETEASTVIGTTIEQAADSEQQAVVAMAQYGAAVLNNGLGTLRGGISGGSACLLGSRRPLCVRVGTAELSSGRTLRQLGPAQAALKRLAAATHPAGTDWGLGLEARSRAFLERGCRRRRLVSRGDRSLGARAAASGARARTPALRGVVAAGESSRRRARAAPRRPRTFRVDRHGGVRRALLPRAAGEGEKARKRTVDTRDDLTAQERQIAHLARDGLSNPDIGARLFLSPRTRGVASGQGVRQARNPLTARLATEPAAASAKLTREGHLVRL